jgi:hypothetical protein
MATYVNAPPSLPESTLGIIVSRPLKDPRSLIGQILRLIARQPHYIGKQRLAKILEASNPARALGIASHRRHPAKHAAPVLSPDLNIYESYAAYCKYVAVEPFTIVFWESLRDEKFPQGKNADHARLRMDTGYHVCPSPADEPACLSRKPECAITFDGQIDRAQRCPFLLKQAAPRLPLVIENQYVPAKGRNQPSIKHESRWCKMCEEYTSDAYIYPLPLNTDCPASYDEHVCPTRSPHQAWSPSVVVPKPASGQGIQLDIDPVTPADTAQDTEDDQHMKGVPLDQFHHWNKILAEYHLSMGRLNFALPLVFMGDLAEFGEGGGDDGRSQGVRRGEAVKKARRKFYAKCARKKEQDREAHVKAACLWCGADIWSKVGTMFCPDTTHRQMFQKYDKDGVLLDLWILANIFGMVEALKESKLWPSLEEKLKWALKDRRR